MSIARRAVPSAHTSLPVLGSVPANDESVRMLILPILLVLPLIGPLIEKFTTGYVLPPLVVKVTLLTMYWKAAAALLVKIVCAAMTCRFPLLMFDVGPWQVLHCESFATMLVLWFAPVAKFTVSWQEPQASAVGTM